MGGTNAPRRGRWSTKPRYCHSDSDFDISQSKCCKCLSVKRESPSIGKKRRASSSTHCWLVFIVRTVDLLRNSPPFLYGQLCFRPSDCDIGVRKAGAWLAPPSSLNPLIKNHCGNSKNDSDLKISTRVYKKKHRNNSSPAHFYSSLSLCFSVKECCS